jgi:uncharacterized protein YuzE
MSKAKSFQDGKTLDMTVTYDRTANAAYIYLLPEHQYMHVDDTYCVDPSEIDGMINLDFYADRKLCGIEVLDADKFLDKAILGIE